MTGLSQPEWLSTLKKDATESFDTQGYPNTKLESWRYTNIKPLVSAPYTLAEPDNNGTPTIPTLETTHARVVIVNGHFDPALSTTSAHVGSLADIVSNPDHQAAAQKLGTASKQAELGLSALNMAHFTDGAFVYLPKRTVLDEPIELVFVSTCGDQHMTHPRSLIVAEEGSQATIITRFIGGSGKYFTNHVSEVICEPGSFVRHITVQDDGQNALHVSTTGAVLQRGATYESLVAQLGAAVGRNEIHVVLADEHARAQLDGLYVATGKQNLDHYTNVDHAAPRAESNELYKGVIDDSAKGTFQARVWIAEGSILSNTNQLNKNLLLSDSAVVNTKPQLEIDNDDVKATHGATVGQLEPDALYYLQSRGLTAKQSRALLIDGFVSEVAERITNAALRNEILQIISDRLGTQKDIA